MEGVQELIKKCVASFSGEGESEFGSLAYSPLSLHEIRERQEWNDSPLSHTIGNSSKGKIYLHYGYLCQRGLYPDEPDKENQDAFKIEPAFDGMDASIMFAVFDGHGEYGDECAGFARENIVSFLSAAKQEHGTDLEKAFRSAFRKLNSAMHYSKDFSDSLSGTTAVVAFFEGNSVWVANVGDSRAIVGKLANGELKATALSTDQTPYRKDERERIRAAGGEIMSVDQREGHVPMHDNWDVDLGAETDTDGDPPRVWVPGKDKPGCAFTRSIGDAMGERVGVIADPELTKKTLKEHDRFVCVCSDGVWEFLTNQAVCNIVGEHDGDALAACRAVVAESYRLWLQFDIRTDDITMVIAFIDFANKKAGNKPGAKGRGSMRTSISLGGDTLKFGGARPVRRGLSKAKRDVIASLAADEGDGGVFMTMDELPVIGKTEAEMGRIRSALSGNFLFASLSDVQRDKAYAAMRRIETGVGDVIYKQGDPADGFYVLDAGEYKYTKMEGGSSGKEEVTHIHATEQMPHPTFGELALMYGGARPATVTCEAPGLLWVIDRKVFKAVIRFGGAGSHKHTRALETLKSIDILRSLSGDMLKKLEKGLEEVHFETGEYIVRQGEETASMYLIMEGHVRCTAKSGATGEEELLMELSAGAYFGERSLLMHMPRAANVVADRRTTCLYLSKDIFEQHLGSLQAIIDDDRKQREHIAKRRRDLQVEAGVEHVDLRDFTLQGVAQDSSFGQWVLAKHTASGNEFTIKAVSKEIASAKNLGLRVMQEARLAAKLVERDRYVPNALQTMVSPAYLLTIYQVRIATGLHEMLEDYGPFDEATTLFYATNVFLGLEHLHKCDVAYRNVNPESIMLGGDGYAVLMDMGFAKEVDSNKLFDLCGLTPYLAPEQVSGIGHGHAVDYWALAILVFEMLTEKTPFASPGDSEEVIYSRIASHFPGALTFPDAFSIELVGIMDKLLDPQPKQRLATADAFRSNPWLQVVNWPELESGSIPAPFGPEAAKLVSTHEEQGASQCLPAAPYKGSGVWFEGFTSHLDPHIADSFAKNRKPSSSTGAQGTTGQPAAVAAVAEEPQESSRNTRLSISGFGKKKNKKDKEVAL
jgi:serine/threonine protein phosphatase PrpC/CRP-like cAMP-binding protein